MAMIYGYARVSTKSQLRGYSLDEQQNLLKQHGCEEIVPEQYTGKTLNRPAFQTLLDKLKSGDTLIVCKIDRLARSLIEGVNTIKKLQEMGVTVNILNLGIIDNSTNGKLTFQILLAIAEWEREMILERTSSGKALARLQPGYREGRPRLPKAKVNHALELLNTHTYKQVEEMTGISVPTLVRYRRAERAKKK